MFTTAPRLELQQKLLDILGTSNVYYQPPSSVVMQYPCITYSRDRTDSVHADNGAYRSVRRYTVMVIDRNPDTDIPDKILQLPMSSHSRSYVANNLNHFVIDLYF